MNTVVSEIEKERQTQIVRWGHSQDDRWTPGEWAALISHYATRQLVGDLHGVDVVAFRADLVKVGALALAAIEALNRKHP